MLKNFFIRKILITTCFLVVLGLIYFLPVNNKNEIKNLNVEIKYVDASKNLHPIYLIDKDGYVSQTKVILESEKIEDKISEIISILQIASEKEHLIPANFKAIIPKDVKLLSLTFKDGIAKLNFNEKFWDVKEEDEVKLIEAIVYSLTTLEEVKGVMIFVGQEIITKLPSSNHTLPSILNRSIGINKVYDIVNRKNIKGVTVYYIKKLEDQNYYVPVTKYVNDEREKINIIIEQLTSTTTYEPTLISYVNSNTKLMDATIENNIISLNFNSAIMSDFDNNKILEEVTEVINLSVKDNYELDEIIYLVDSKQITKNCLKGC